MTAEGEMLSVAYKSQSISLALAAAYSFENRCATVVEESIKEFITGAEGSAVDCGVYVGKDKIQHMQGTERTFTLIKKYQNEKVLLPIEFKMTHPAMTTSGHTRVYQYQIHRSERQSVCCAFIVGSTYSPDFVAFIPSHYLDPDHDPKAIKILSRKFPVSSTRPPPFAAEWTPFVLPIAQLPEAIQSMVNFYKDKRKPWINPYNGFIFENCPQPEAQLMSVLYPANPVAKVNDHDMIERFWSSFEEHGRHFKVERMCIKPAHGDFQIIHKETGVRLCIELKMNQFTTDDSRHPRTITHNAGFFRNVGDLIFLWKRQFDWLITCSVGEGATHLPKHGLVISRDEVPIEWFDYKPKSNKLVWTPSNPGFFRDHLVKFTFDQSFVDGIENILLAAPSMVAQRKIPAQPVRVEAGEDDLLTMSDHEDDLAEVEEIENILEARTPRWERFYLAQYEVLQYEWLMKLCMTSKYGIVYLLGAHYGGRVAFVPWRWSSKDVETFKTHGILPCELIKLPHRTPMIYLNFFDVNFLDTQNPDDNMRRGMLHVTEGFGKSIYIMDAAPGNKANVPHSRFLVPSTSLDTEDRRKANKDLLKKKYATNLIAMTQDELLDVYATEEEDVISELRRIFKPNQSGDAIDWGNPQAVRNAKVKPSDFLVHQSEVAELFILTLEKKGAWFQFSGQWETDQE